MGGLKILKPVWISLTWTGKIWKAKLSWWWRKMSEIGLPFVMARSKAKDLVYVYTAIRKFSNNKLIWTWFLATLSITLILEIVYLLWNFQNQRIYLVRSCFKNSIFLNDIDLEKLKLQEQIKRTSGKLHTIWF